LQSQQAQARIEEAYENGDEKLVFHMLHAQNRLKNLITQIPLTITDLRQYGHVMNGFSISNPNSQVLKNKTSTQELHSECVQSCVKKMETAEATSILIGADQGIVVEELERLKQKLGAGYELTVKWLPRKKLDICGEVREDCIYVYEEEEQKALETVKHEFLDYLVSKMIEPYQRIANKLIGLINDEAYSRKEKLVDILAALI